MSKLINDITIIIASSNVGTPIVNSDIVYQIYITAANTIADTNAILYVL
jgi:hypothetical protein